MIYISCIYEQKVEKHVIFLYGIGYQLYVSMLKGNDAVKWIFDAENI